MNNEIGGGDEKQLCGLLLSETHNLLCPRYVNYLLQFSSAAFQKEVKQMLLYHNRCIHLGHSEKVEKEVYGRMNSTAVGATPTLLERAYSRSLSENRRSLESSHPPVTMLSAKQSILQTPSLTNCVSNRTEISASKRETSILPRTRTEALHTPRATIWLSCRTSLEKIYPWYNYQLHGQCGKSPQMTKTRTIQMTLRFLNHSQILHSM